MKMRMNITSPLLYYSLKRIVLAKPNSSVFIVNILARTDNSPTDENPYNDMLEKVAHYFGLPVIDVRNKSGINPNVPGEKTLLIPDGLHPNVNGYKKMARCIVQHIKEWVIVE